MVTKLVLASIFEQFFCFLLLFLLLLFVCLFVCGMCVCGVCVGGGGIVCVLFLSFFFKNVNVFMFVYLEPNIFIENFLWEKSFTNFGRDYFCGTKILFVAAILKRNIFLMFFLLIYDFLYIYRYQSGASFVPKSLRENI